MTNVNTCAFPKEASSSIHFGCFSNTCFGPSMLDFHELVTCTNFDMETKATGDDASGGSITVPMHSALTFDVRELNVLHVPLFEYSLVP